MTVISPPLSEDDISPAVTPASTPSSSSLTSSSAHPRSSFYSHRLQMWVHDKDSPLSSSTAGSFSFARSVATPLPVTLVRPSSPPTFSALVPSPRPSSPAPRSRLLLSHLRPRLFLALLFLCLTLLFFFGASSFLRRWPFFFRPAPVGISMADYIAAHPLSLTHPLLPSTADHTHSPSISSSETDAEAENTAAEQPTVQPMGQGTNFISRAVHLEAVARRKRAAAIKVAEAEKAGWSKEEKRDEEAQRMLGKLKAVIEGSGVEEAEVVQKGGRGLKEKKGKAKEVVDLKDASLKPWSAVRLRGDEEVQALQHRPT